MSMHLGVSLSLAYLSEKCRDLFNSPFAGRLVRALPVNQ